MYKFIADRDASAGDEAAGGQHAYSHQRRGRTQQNIHGNSTKHSW